jgi:hypothetical protein
MHEMRSGLKDSVRLRMCSVLEFQGMERDGSVPREWNGSIFCSVRKNSRNGTVLFFVRLGAELRNGMAQFWLSSPLCCIQVNIPPVFQFWLSTPPPLPTPPPHLPNPPPPCRTRRRSRRSRRASQQPPPPPSRGRAAPEGEPRRRGRGRRRGRAAPGETAGEGEGDGRESRRRRSLGMERHGRKRKKGGSGVSGVSGDIFASVPRRPADLAGSLHPAYEPNILFAGMTSFRPEAQPNTKTSTKDGTIPFHSDEFQNRTLPN